MKNNPSSFSLVSISKFKEGFSSNMTLDTLNFNSVLISFRVIFNTTFGQGLYIIGNIDQLGKWDITKAIPMYTEKGLYPIWISKKFDCRIGIEIDYKYFIKDGSKIIWEDLGPNINRHFTVSTPWNIIIFDEQYNNKSKIGYFENDRINNENIDISNTEINLYRSLISSMTPKQKELNDNKNNNDNNIKIITSQFCSKQSLSSYNKISDTFLIISREKNNIPENINFKSNDATKGENTLTNYSNKENYSKFGMINTGQDIESEDKVVIVTTCLPFIIEFKSNSDDKYKIVLKEDN